MNISPLIKSLAGGVIATAAFSITTPATKIAVNDFSPLAVTGIRGLVAGLFCALYLLWARKPIPNRSTLLQLATIALIGSCGFAGFLALGLQTVPAVHASVFLAMLPLLTAMFSQWLLPEPVTPLFWFGSALGTSISMGYMLHRSHGALAVGDAFLLVAVICAAWGYVRAAKHTRALGGAVTMSWIVISGSPLYLTLLLLGQPDFARSIAPSSFFALGYLGMVSQSLGMFLWCWSLSTGYSALVAQTQTIQPFLSILAASVLLGEAVEPHVVGVTAIVVGCVVLATYARVRASSKRIAMAGCVSSSK